MRFRLATTILIWFYLAMAPRSVYHAERKPHPLGLGSAARPWCGSILELCRRAYVNRRWWRGGEHQITRRTSQPVTTVTAAYLPPVRGGRPTRPLPQRRGKWSRY